MNQYTRRTLLLGAAGATTLTAGCLDALDGDDDFEFPPGFSENGITDEDDAFGEESPMEEITSYSVEIEEELVAGPIEVTRSTVEQADGDVSERNFTYVEEEPEWVYWDRTEDHYIAGGYIYSKIGEGDGAVYTREETDLEPSAAHWLYNVRTVDNATEWTLDGINDGIATYSASEEDIDQTELVGNYGRIDWWSYLMSRAGVFEEDSLEKLVEELEGLHSEFDVDADGMIHRFGIEWAHENGEFSQELEITDIGETTVVEPEWTDEATDPYGVGDEDTRFSIQVNSSSFTLEETDTEHTFFIEEDIAEAGQLVTIYGIDENGDEYIVDQVRLQRQTIEDIECEWDAPDDIGKSCRPGD